MHTLALQRAQRAAECLPGGRARVGAKRGRKLMESSDDDDDDL